MSTNPPASQRPSGGRREAGSRRRRRRRLRPPRRRGPVGLGPSTALLALGLALLLALLAGWSLGPASAQAEPAAGPGTTLEPGHNYLGWVSDALDVAVLREQMPELASVRAWDAASARAYTPARLTPGMGLRITIAGAESVSWRRPLTPARGRVDLAAGRNLVAWSGGETSIAEAVRGIGEALVRAWSPEGADSLERGDALWVEVGRRVRWLQPTGALPGLHFPGGAAPPLRAEIGRDLREVVEFAGAEFGVQVDFSGADIYVATDAESYIAYRGLVGGEAEEARGLWAQAGGWATQGAVAVLKQADWQQEEGTAARSRETEPDGRYVLAHEYFHLLQHQLSGGIDEAPAWLIEGGANWFEWLLAQRDQGAATAALLQPPAYTTEFDEAPALEQLESTTELGYEYGLGERAHRLLTATRDLAGPVEFWRALLPDPLGPQARWLPLHDWPRAFRDAFKITAQQFYGEVERWRASHHPGSPSVRLLGPGGRPLAGLPVFIRESRAGSAQRWPVTRPTSAEGWALLPVDADATSYIVGVELGDCRVFASTDGIAYLDALAQRYPVGATAPAALVITLPADACTWRLSGRLSDAAGAGLAGLRVDLLADDAGAHTVSGADGRFRLTAPRAGRYRLALERDGCTLYWAADGLTGDRHRAALLDLSRADLAGLEVQLGPGLCGSSITGRIVDPAGNPYPADHIYALREGSLTEAAVAADGTFSLTVPAAGRYRLLLESEGCQVYYRSGGVAAQPERAESVGLDDAAAAALTIRVPDGICARWIRGVLAGGGGAPLIGRVVSAVSESGAVGYGFTDHRGRFSFRVPEPGAYVLSAELQACTLYWTGREVAAAAAPQDARTVLVRQRDVLDLNFRLPAALPPRCR